MNPLERRSRRPRAHSQSIFGRRFPAHLWKKGTHTRITLLRIFQASGSANDIKL